MYLYLLEIAINPGITDILDQDDIYHTGNLIFQTPLHYAMPEK